MKANKIFKCFLIASLILSAGFGFSQKNQKSAEAYNFANGSIIVSDDGTAAGKLSTSATSYDVKIIGVYVKETIEPNSDGTPKLIPSNNEKVVSQGIISVKCNTENGKIKSGDLITTSSTAGEGMKAIKSGVILGIATEDAKEENGLVKVRLMIQYVSLQ